MWWTVVNKIQSEYFLAQLNSTVLYLSLSAVICRGSSVLQSTCLHSEPPWAHSSWAPVWRCCQVAARCPLRMTSECTRLVSEGVLGAPHLYTQDTQHVIIKIYVADYYSAFYTSTIVQWAWLLTKKKHWIFSTPSYSVFSVLSHSTHHSWGCTGCLRWERSAFWKDLRSRLCLVWRAAACRGARHLPSTPHHPDSHLNHITDKTKIKLLISLLNETNTAALWLKVPTVWCEDFEVQWNCGHYKWSWI